MRHLPASSAVRAAVVPAVLLATLAMPAAVAMKKTADIGTAARTTGSVSGSSAAASTPSTAPASSFGTTSKAGSTTTTASTPTTSAPTTAASATPPQGGSSSGRDGQGTGAPPAGGVAGSSASGGNGLLVDAGTPGTTPVITMAGIGPGASASTPVRVRNATGREIALRMRMTGVVDEPLGRYGGRLSDKLAYDLLDPASGRPLGAPTTKSSSPTLTTMRQGESRTFTLRLRFPDGGVPASATSGDNAVMGGSAQVMVLFEGVTGR